MTPRQGYEGVEEPRPQPPEPDFRPPPFEPPLLLAADLQGLDMSSRGGGGGGGAGGGAFHYPPNVPAARYHPLYPEGDRGDHLRLGYSPPPPYAAHDLLRAVSLDLTASPGRHSVDLSLRGHHALHQLGGARLLEHGLQGAPHRLLDQGRWVQRFLALIFVCSKFFLRFLFVFFCVWVEVGTRRIQLFEMSGNAFRFYYDIGYG